MAKSELLDFYAAWQVAEEEQAKSSKRVATHVEECHSSSNCPRPKRKKKNLPTPLKTVDVKIENDIYDNLSPLDMIAMKAAPCDGSDAPPADPLLPTEPSSMTAAAVDGNDAQPDHPSPTEDTSEDERQNSKWYHDIDAINDALLTKLVSQELEERKQFHEQQAAFQQAQVAVAMAKAPCLQQGQAAVAMAKAPWRFQPSPEVHGRDAGAHVASKPSPKIQAVPLPKQQAVPLPKQQASWPNTCSLPSAPAAKASVEPRQPCRVTGKAGKTYEGRFYESLETLVGHFLLFFVCSESYKYQ